MPNLAYVSASYLIYDSRIDTKFRFPAIEGCREIIIMNEQGANSFDTYKDSDGLILKGNKIGSWDEIKANLGNVKRRVDILLFCL